MSTGLKHKPSKSLYKQPDLQGSKSSARNHIPTSQQYRTNNEVCTPEYFSLTQRNPIPTTARQSYSYPNYDHRKVSTESLKEDLLI